MATRAGKPFFGEAVQNAGDVAVGHLEMVGQVGHLQPVGIAVQCSHHVKTWQSGAVRITQAFA